MSVTRVRAQSGPTLCDPMDSIACQAPLSMKFFRQEYWSWLPLPPPGDLLHTSVTVYTTYMVGKKVAMSESSETTLQSWEELKNTYQKRMIIYWTLKCPSPSNHDWPMILEDSCWSKYPLFSQTGTRLLFNFNLDKCKMSSSSSSIQATSLQSCPTLSDPMDYSPPGSSVHGIFQERILEWVAISFSRGSSWSRDPTQISCIGSQVFTTRATWEALQT